MNDRILHVYRHEDFHEYQDMVDRDERCTEMADPVRVAHLFIRKVKKEEHRGRHVIWLHLKDGDAIRIYINQEGRVTATQKFPRIPDTRFDFDMKEISKNSAKKEFQDTIREVARNSHKIDFGQRGVIFWSNKNPSRWLSVNWTGVNAKTYTSDGKTEYFEINKKVFDSVIRTVIEEMTKEKLQKISGHLEKENDRDC